jgi:hypothetical protein
MKMLVGGACPVLARNAHEREIRAEINNYTNAQNGLVDVIGSERKQVPQSVEK